MATETKEPKKTRKAKDQKLRDKTDKLLLEASPELMATAINASFGVARNVTCPYCEGKFDAKLGDKANKELLKTLIEQFRGKPKQTQEVDLKATLELNSGQNLRLFHAMLDSVGITLADIQEILDKKNAANIGVIEAEFKAIKEPELPNETPAVATPFFEPLKVQEC